MIALHVQKSSEPSILSISGGIVARTPPALPHSQHSFTPMPKIVTKNAEPQPAARRPLPASGHAIPSSFSAMLPALTNQCFGCGPANRSGLRWRFFDEGAGDRALCRVKVPQRFEGPPGHVHGGII